MRADDNPKLKLFDVEWTEITTYTGAVRATSAREVAEAFNSRVVEFAFPPEAIRSEATDDGVIVIDTETGHEERFDEE